ncbi:MAG: HAMP domain-containing protein [Alphaproteobacteria bacterium]|nr:HAMP domain-containing protein [Alphaproteobacteria bacterium]
MKKMFHSLFLLFKKIISFKSLSKKLTFFITLAFLVMASLFMTIFTGFYSRQLLFEWNQAQEKLGQITNLLSQNRVLKSYLRNEIKKQNLVKDVPLDILTHLDDIPVNENFTTIQSESQIRYKAVQMGFFVLMLSSLLLFIILMILLILLKKYILIPLNKVVDMSKEISSGNFKARIDLDKRAPDEIDTLALNFNRMGESLEQSLKDLEERDKFQQALIDSIPDSLCLIDKTYKILTVNKAYLEQIGLKNKEQVLGRNCFEMNHNRKLPCEQTKVKCPLQEIMKNKKPFKTIQSFSPFHKKNPFYVDISAAPLDFSIEGKKFTFVVESIRDLTKDIQFSHQQKVSSLGFLSTSIAHEMRNPLGSVRLVIEGLLDQIDKGKIEKKETLSYLRRVNEQISLCIDVTSRLLKLARFNKNPVTQKVDIQQTLIETLGLLDYEAKKRGVSILFHKTRRKPFVRIVESDIQMVFVNLIQNAFHAMKSDGKLEISFKRKKENILIEIKDNGEGIKKELLPRIFEPFVSSRLKEGKTESDLGSGLGLTIVRNIIQSNQGTVSVKSQEGKGTSFTICLPSWLEEETDV